MSVGNEMNVDMVMVRDINIIAMNMGWLNFFGEVSIG
jgi:hypothetical protein